jgi:hypothetical protein
LALDAQGCCVLQGRFVPAQRLPHRPLNLSLNVVCIGAK